MTRKYEKLKKSWAVCNHTEHTEMLKIICDMNFDLYPKRSDYEPRIKKVLIDMGIDKKHFKK